MAGYAATARITRVAPHRVAQRRDAPAEGDLVELDAPAVVELSGQPFLATVTYVWDDIREIWRQGMDVLRDPRIIP